MSMAKSFTGYCNCILQNLKKLANLGVTFNLDLNLVFNTNQTYLQLGNVNNVLLSAITEATF